MAYTKVGPFTNDSAVPPIDKTFLDGLETWAETTGTKVDGIEAGATADQTAAEVTYDNTTSALAAAQLQAAVDEVVVDIADTATNAETYADAAVNTHDLAGATAHIDKPRYFVGDGTGTYVQTNEMRIYVSHTSGEADPDLTGLPAGILVVTVP